ncbi:YHYH domain-containing protein [Acinetobacter sp. NIPH 2699]|nr:YHYH domain-containing protein [Acinetobacter sp. NIPH 2699]MCH7335196.1 YHYH domain-containing protein [Acinetobacter sp. NIPH 2699]
MPELNHSGNTDKCGCHNTRSTGEYHCHNRKQRGGDCPP